MAQLGGLVWSTGHAHAGGDRRRQHGDCHDAVNVAGAAGAVLTGGSCGTAIPGFVLIGGPAAEPDARRAACSVAENFCPVVSDGGSAQREDLRMASGTFCLWYLVLFFLVLAGAAIALKLTGLSWDGGFSSRSPLFLAFMVVLVRGFAAILWDLFYIPLPACDRRHRRVGTITMARTPPASAAISRPGRSRRCWRRPAPLRSWAQPSASRWRAARWKSSPSSPLSALASPCPICWWQPSRPWHRACRAPAAGCWCCAGCLAARWR